VSPKINKINLINQYTVQIIHEINRPCCRTCSANLSPKQSVGEKSFRRARVRGGVVATQVSPESVSRLDWARSRQRLSGRSATQRSVPAPADRRTRPRDHQRCTAGVGKPRGHDTTATPRAQNNNNTTKARSLFPRRRRCAKRRSREAFARRAGGGKATGRGANGPAAPRASWSAPRGLPPGAGAIEKNTWRRAGGRPNEAAAAAVGTATPGRAGGRRGWGRTDTASSRLV
jgi:hypothetical protein